MKGKVPKGERRILEKTILRKIIAIYFLVVILASAYYWSSTGISVAKENTKNSELMNKWMEMYLRVYRLRSKGVNTEKLEIMLANIYNAIKENKTPSVVLNQMLREIDRNISILESKADRIVFYSKLEKAYKVIILLSVPVIFYIIFPRVYIEIFFRLKKKWTVLNSESTR